MICIGQSHMVCVLAAAEEAGTRLDAVVLKEVRTLDVLEETAYTIEHPERLSPETTAKLASGQPVVSFVGGLFHMHLTLGRHPQPFDFVLPEAPDLPLETGAEVVPSGAMRELLLKGAERHLHAFELITELAGGQLYHVESPPPPAESWLDFRMARARARREGTRKVKREETNGRPKGKRRLAEVELAAPLLRYKIWRLHSQIVREQAERLGVRFVAHPAEAVDEDGFLRAEYCRNATHANSGYGALVLEQLKALA